MLEPIQRFEKFTDLQAKHTALIKQQRDEGIRSAFLETVQYFIEQGRASGAMLDGEADRDDTQTILDYWATRLVREGRPLPDTTLAEFDPTLAPELPDLPCPYRGLNAFTDAQFFYGREEVTATVLQKLRNGAQLVAVVGPSGSGKSSLVLGGVLDALKQGAVREANAVREADVPSDSTAWHILPTLLPGQHALTRLDAALSHASGNAPNLLVIDQFEELFTLTRDEAQSRAFAERLMTWLAQGNRILLSLRSDFEERMQGLPALYEAFEHGRVDLRPMSIAALRSTIEKPATEVGLRFDEGIVDDVLGKILGVNEGLPLLQFTLLKLWKLRQRNRITWEVYRRLGEDPRRALGKTAEDLYQRLTPAQQSIAKRLLLKLVTPKEGENEFTRNRLSRSELAAGENPERVTEVLQTLLDEGLLRSTGNEAQIEVMHEALVRNWPTLDQWLRDERSSLERRFLLQRRAAQWDKDGRPSATGLSGRELEEAARLEGLDDLTQAYVNASVAAQQATETRERNRLIEQARAEERAKLRETQLQQAQATAKAERRRRQVVSVLLVISLLASAIAGWSFWQLQKSLALAEERRVEAEKAFERATTAEKNARSRELATTAQTILEDNPETSLLVALEANKIATTYDARKVLEKGLPLNASYTSLNTASKAYSFTAWSPDGEKILVIDTFIEIFEVKTSKKIKQLDNLTLRSIKGVWSPDTKQILLMDAAGMAYIWNWIAHINEATLIDLRSLHLGESPKWSLNGKKIFSVSNNHINILNVYEDINIIQYQISGLSPTTFLQWSSSGEQLITYDSIAIKIWDIYTGKELRNINVPQDNYRNKISPDGKRVVVTEPTVGGQLNRVIDIGDNYKDDFIFNLPVNCHCEYVKWSPDGKKLLITGVDSNSLIWDYVTNKISQVNGSIPFESFDNIWDPDSEKVFLMNTGGMISIWDVISNKEIIKFHAITRHIKWSPNRIQISAYSLPGELRVWNVNATQDVNELIGYLQSSESSLSNYVWSPNGSYILLVNNNSLQIWNLNLGWKLAHLNETSRDSISYVNWSPDSNKVIIAYANGTARVWDINTAQITSLIGHTDLITYASWSSDSKRILT